MAQHPSEQLLFLTDEQLRQGIELMFFAYRDLTAEPDAILAEHGYGRAHHRAIHFINRRPGLTIAELLAILRVTKQSLNRVLRQLIDDGFVESRPGETDRRQRLLTLTDKGAALEKATATVQRARIRQAYREAGPEAVAGFRRVLEAMIDGEARDPCAEPHRRRADPGETEMSRAESNGDHAGHLLIIDDDQRIRELLKRYLTRHGYLVTLARDAAHASRILEGLAFDLLIVDVMMPGESGTDFTRRMRAAIDTPILLLTARAEASDRIDGLEAGADDYLPKPFEPRELLLRCAAILRRAAPVFIEGEPDAPQALGLGATRYNLVRGELMRGEEAVRLTTTEQALMRVFAEAPNTAISRERLAAELGGPAGGVQERAVDVQITRLRRKIERDPKNPRYLQTVRGEGYMLTPD